MYVCVLFVAVVVLYFSLSPSCALVISPSHCYLAFLSASLCFLLLLLLLSSSLISFLLLLLVQGHGLHAYFMSISDSTRTLITKDELCMFDWNFRFKDGAGSLWLQEDPWWNDRPAILRRFFPDNVMTPAFRWDFVVAGKRDPTAQEGTTVAMSTFPPVYVGRFSNWGFTLQSCWVGMTCFAMPLQGDDPDLEAHLTAVTVNDQIVDVLNFNSGPLHLEGLPVIEDESDIDYEPLDDLDALPF